MRNFQTFFKDEILPANIAGDAAVWFRTLTSTLNKILSVPSGARYACFAASSSLTNADFAAQFGTSAITTTTTAFPATDSTAGTDTVINPKIRYLDPAITTIGLSTPRAALALTVEFFV